ncbi:hypothetical protein PGT21_036180 [Puccinia graminis f. sp. tritici]|uniref:Uncharacterized protein n=1 Tax=Puccinia graminis f. sp. tritici TaxID=56615 RepID=A0A5B0MHT3_PUCGR|nr:hypothetical protein PGTUg99_037395 [Puccinia graminis f. sp. tritici]KAA1091606.1 hypothetical protein PGT21_036180 [Puccinia graminis f. sp. tritici]
MALRLFQTMSHPQPPSHPLTTDDLICYHTFVDKLTRMRAINHQSEGVDKRKPTPHAHAIAEWRAGRQAIRLQVGVPACTPNFRS